MQCTLEWKYFGSLRDIFVYGYLESEYNQPPMLYAIFVEHNKYKDALKSLEAKYEKLKSSSEKWEQDDAQLLMNEWKKSRIEMKADLSEYADQIPLYFGKTTKLIAHRLVESFDRGSFLPLFLLDLRASEISVLVGLIKKGDKEFQSLSEDKKIDAIEYTLIKKYNPLLNKDRREPPVTLEINFIGNHTAYFKVGK